MTWERGREVVERLLDEDHLEVVPPNDDHALRMLDEAQAHLRSADLIRDEDPVGAINIAYTGAHKAAAATLATQGLRPTRVGGHYAVEEAVRAQFDSGFIAAFGRFGRLRRRRHDLTYPNVDSVPPDADEASEVIELARDIVDAAQQFVESDRLSPFVR